MNIKETILDAAETLMIALSECEDDDFVEEVVNAVYYNDMHSLRCIDTGLREY